MKIEIKNTILFTIVSNTMKRLGIHLTKHVQDLTLKLLIVNADKRNQRKPK